MERQLPTNETSQAKPSALPDSWISALFNKLSSMYGSRFTDMWRGTDIDSVRAVWAEKLAVYPPEILKYALDQCDTLPRPPSLPEFLIYCKEGMKHYHPPLAISAERTTPKEEARVRMRQIMEKSGFRMSEVLKDMPK